jgi:hypothetical protein
MQATSLLSDKCRQDTSTGRPSTIIAGAVVINKQLIVIFIDLSTLRTYYCAFAVLH